MRDLRERAEFGLEVVRLLGVRVGERLQRDFVSGLAIVRAIDDAVGAATHDGDHLEAGRAEKRVVREIVGRRSLRRHCCVDAWLRGCVAA